MESRSVGSTTVKIAPRWEWRAFSQALAWLEARIGLSIQVEPKQSEEIYLLNATMAQNAKIRSRNLEIKILSQIDADGLECWNPAFKSCFPLSGPRLADACAILGFRQPAIRRGQYSIHEFLQEIVRLDGTLQPVRVSKARRQFVFCGCAAELVRVRIGDIRQESFCVEDEKPHKVLAALRELELDPKANVNFPKGLARALHNPH